MNQIFLGEPSYEIKSWFIENFPSWPAYTTLEFVDGSTETKEISGTATRQNIFDEQISDCGENEKAETLVYCQLGKNVTEISGYAFNGCYSLTSINIPNSVTSIGSSTFYYCSSLPSITIPNSVTSIGDNLFYYCSSLISINIPNSVTSIGGGAFQSCRSLTSINIPSSVISIGIWAFGYCYSLPSINIPSSVTSIGSNAFYSCSSLTSVIFEGRTSTEISAMSGYPWGAKTSAIIPGIS